MASLKDINVKFVTLIDKLLMLTQTKINDKKSIDSSLCDLNELEYKYLDISNTDAVMLLINQLLLIAQPTETSLVRNTCQLLVNLLQNNFSLQERTFIACERWVLEALEFSEYLAQGDLLLTLQNLLATGQMHNVNQNLHILLGNKGLLAKHLNPKVHQWSELNLHALGCLEAILGSRKNTDPPMMKCFRDTIKETVKNISFLLPLTNYDQQYYNQTIVLCLKILNALIVDKLLIDSPDFVGESLGIVRAFLFHGIKNYTPVQPEILRPVAMNLPEQRVHTIPKCRNAKNNNQRTKTSKKGSLKNNSTDIKNSSFSETKNSCRYSSDSDTSDNENTTTAVNVPDFKVRLEAMRLLQVLCENIQTREIFGYWPQIVSSGTRNDARVLTRSILKEPVTKVRQIVLNVLNKLLIDAKPFLIHAEDAEHTSFISFFGTVSLMIKELHLTLSLALSAERNVAVLTGTLKCAAALIQVTPYARLKSGLATKLIRNCRPHINHKDPTVRVATLSVFETLASCDPMTQEIIDILSRQSHTEVVGIKSLNLSINRLSDIETEEEEVDVEDFEDNNSFETGKEIQAFDKNGISALVRICLENILNETVSTPVQLKSLKVLGTLSYSVQSLIFDHMETVTEALISLVQTSETQTALHACRVLEIMADCLTNKDTNDERVGIFWNIILESIISLVQHEQTVLREVGCDCLGNIGGKMLTQLTREKTILIITILFGTVHDEESAVRAAGLRALGMLVTLTPLEEDSGFLMDLSDMVCSGLEDKNLGVRIKAAWTLANLCDTLIRRKNNNEATEPLPLDILLPKLYNVSVKAAKDNDKVKCNAVRAVGCILHFCPERKILNDTTLGMEVLINCAIKGNDMKVRWNACRAIGLVLSNNPDNILPPSWKDHIFPALCNLVCHCPNFKVRTNAAWALSMYDKYGKYMPVLWKTIVLAFENSQHVPSYMEYPHRDALVQQLCLTLSHLAAHTNATELLNLWTEIGEHLHDISNYMKQFQETVLPEKSGELVEAKVQLEKLSVCDSSTQEQRQIAKSLASIFEKTSQYDY